MKRAEKLGMLAVLGLALLAVSTSATADDLERAIANAEHEIAAWRMLPKQDLYSSGHLYVLADGSLQDRDQGKRDFPIETRPVCLRRGQSYQFIRGKKRRPYLRIKARRNGLEIELGVNCVTFHVALGRRPAATDLEPRALARSLSGFFELEGAPETTAVARALLEMERSGEPSSVDPAATPPPLPTAVEDSVVRLEVRASPKSVPVGDEVELVLDYEVRAIETLSVRERWTLSFAGSALPSFPSERVVERRTGSFEPSLPQGVPPYAEPGEYVFKGEVCAGEECISRIARFRVTERSPR